MDSVKALAEHTTEAPGPISAPRLLVELEPTYRVFFRNLQDLIFPRQLPALRLTSKPAPFWPDVLIPDQLPWRGLFDSLAGHLLVVTAVYALAFYGFFGRPQQQVRNPFHNTITYYSVSEYLPELDSGSKPARVDLAGQPAYAKQEIISVPAEPDNTRQTIITPWEMKLNRNVPLPNVVAWDPTIPAPPISATPGKKLKIPVQPQVVAPAPEPVTRSGAIQLPAELLRRTAVAPPVDPISAKSKDFSNLQAHVVSPAVEPDRIASRDLHNFHPEVVPPVAEVVPAKPNLPVIAVPSVVEPAISIHAARRRPGALNIARSQPEVSAPRLPVSEQQAMGMGQAPATSGGGTGGVATAAANRHSAPATQGRAAAGPTSPAQGAGGEQGGGQLIALNVDPVEASGSIDVPSGSRRGVFAASPAGLPGAPGTPELKKGADGKGGNSGTEGSGPGAGNRSVPDGLFVGRGSGQAPPGAVVAAKPAAPAQSGRNLRDQLVAAARPPDITRQPSSGSTIPKPERQIEDKIFGTKKYYSLTLNMPNLSSSTGSWVIRFAELKHSRDAIDLAAPVPLNKVDPAYPADLVRDKVEGTVVLYAIIHADGTVGEIRVLNGIEDRLDENASKALAGWRFRPATKNGEAVDLEAVVQIPFRVRRPAF